MLAMLGSCLVNSVAVHFALGQSRASALSQGAASIKVGWLSCFIFAAHACTVVHSDPVSLEHKRLSTKRMRDHVGVTGH